MNETHAMGPLVSVVVPCYNHENYVRECLQSIINQNYKNIELIVIDDGSKDTSVAVIEEMRAVCQARFVRFEFISRENRGLCNTLNQALDWCKGIYVATIASDDIWMPFKIQIQTKYLEMHPEAVAVFGGIMVIDESGKVTRKIEKPGSFDFRDIFLQKHFLPAPTALVRKLELQAVGYDPAIGVEDWNMWLKLSNHQGIRLVALKEIVAAYRRHQSNMSRNAELMHDSGLKILAQFSDHADYKQAVAEHELAMSAMLAFENKKKSIFHFLLYLKTGRYSLRAISVFVKILTPDVFSRFIR